MHGRLLWHRSKGLCPAMGSGLRRPIEPGESRWNTESLHCRSGCRRHKMLPWFAESRHSADVGRPKPFLRQGSDPEHLRFKTEGTESFKLSISPFIIDSKVVRGVRRKIVSIKLRQVDGEGDNGKGRCFETFCEKNVPHHRVTLKIGHGIGGWSASNRVGRFLAGMGWIRICNSHHKMLTSDPGSHDVFEVIIMKYLEPSMHNTQAGHRSTRNLRSKSSNCFCKKASCPGRQASEGSNHHALFQQTSLHFRSLPTTTPLV